MAFLSEADLADFRATSLDAMPDRAALERPVTGDVAPDPNAPLRSPRARGTVYEPVPGMEAVPCRIYRPQIGEGPDGSGGGSTVNTNASPRIVFPYGTDVLAGWRAHVEDEAGSFVLLLKAPVAPATYSVHVEFEAETVNLGYALPGGGAGSLNFTLPGASGTLLLL